jgi:hypothetical protein
METATNGNITTNRVSWTDSEVDHIAQAFIYEREHDAIGNAIEMLRRAIQKTVDEGNARFRDINTWVAVPDIKARVETLWLEKMAAQNPEPHIVHVETQVPPDYVDMLHRCDLPSLTALLVAKLQEQLGTLKPLLNAFTPPSAAPVGAPAQAPVSLLSAASSKPRKTRVLIVGPLNSQFREIENKVAESNIPVDLIWLDKDKSNPGAVVNADYVVATAFINHKLNEVLRSQVPKGKAFFLQGEGITAVVNKLRDIGTLLPPRA